MPVNGTPPGIGPARPPLTPDSGTPLRRANTTVAPPLGGASTRAQSVGGPPLRANSLPATPGLRAPPGATLPPRRNTLPPARALPGSPEAGLLPSMQGFPGMAPHAGAQSDPMKQLSEQMGATLKSAQDINDKLIKTANEAADGVKGAVSPPSA